MTKGKEQAGVRRRVQVSRATREFTLANSGCLTCLSRGVRGQKHGTERGKVVQCLSLTHGVGSVLVDDQIPQIREVHHVQHRLDVDAITRAPGQVLSVQRHETGIVVDGFLGGLQHLGALLGVGLQVGLGDHLVDVRVAVVA